MIYTEVDSSMIDLVGYDEKKQVLEVRFVNSGLTYFSPPLPLRRLLDRLLILHVPQVLRLVPFVHL